MISLRVQGAASFDLCISGINRGDNCGLHIIYRCDQPPSKAACLLRLSFAGITTLVCLLCFLIPGRSGTVGAAREAACKVRGLSSLS